MKANTFISACNLFSFAFVLDLNPVSPNTGFKRCLSSLPCKRFYLLESHSVCFYSFSIRFCESHLHFAYSFLIWICDRLCHLNETLKVEPMKLLDLGKPVYIWIQPAARSHGTHVTLPLLADWKWEGRGVRWDCAGCDVAGWGLPTDMAMHARHCLYLAFKLFIDPMTLFSKHGIIFPLYFL